MSGRSLGELYAEIRISHEKLKSGADLSKKEIEKLSRDVDRYTAQINEKLSSIGKTMSLTVTAPIAIAGAQMTRTFMAFEQSMQNTYSVMGASRAEMEALRTTAEDLGRATRFSASQAADAMYYLGSSGMNAKQSIAALDGVLKLAGATQSELAFTSDTVASTLSQFNLAADQSGRVANVFAAAISGSQATMDKLAYSMRYVGPIAAGFGQSLEGTSASLMALYNAGFKGEQAGTILRAAFTRLADPSKELTDTLKTLGLTIEDVSPSHNAFADILDKIKNSGADTATVIKLFGQEAGSGMAKLVSMGGDVVKNYEQMITGTNKAAEMQATQNKSMANTVDELQSAWEALSITLIGDVSPAINGVLQAMTGMIRGLETMPGPVRAVGAGLLTMAATAGPLLMLAGNVQKVTAAMTALKVITMTNPWVAVIAGAAGVAVALSALSGQWEQARREEEAALQAQRDKQIATLKDERERIARYQELSAKKKLSVAEDKELLEIMAKLKEEFPGLNSAYDANTQAVRLNNAELEKAVRHRANQRLMGLQITRFNLEEEKKGLEKSLADQKAIMAAKKADIDAYAKSSSRMPLDSGITFAYQEAEHKVALIEKRIKQINTDWGFYNAQVAETSGILSQLDEKAAPLADPAKKAAAKDGKSQGQRLAELDAEWQGRIALVKERGGDEQAALLEWHESRLKLLDSFVVEDMLAGKTYAESVSSGFAAAKIGDNTVTFGKMGEEARKSLAFIQEASHGVLSELYNISRAQGVSLDGLLGDPAKVAESKDAITRAIDAIGSKIAELKSKGGDSAVLDDELAKWEALRDRLKEALGEEDLFEAAKKRFAALTTEIDRAETSLNQMQAAHQAAIAAGDDTMTKFWAAQVKQLKAKIKQLEEERSGGPGKSWLESEAVDTAKTGMELSTTFANAMADGIRNGWDSVDWGSLVAKNAAEIGGLISSAMGQGTAVAPMFGLVALVYETMSAVDGVITEIDAQRRRKAEEELRRYNEMVKTITDGLAESLAKAFGRSENRGSLFDRLVGDVEAKKFDDFAKKLGDLKVLTDYRDGGKKTDNPVNEFLLWLQGVSNDMPDVPVYETINELLIKLASGAISDAEREKIKKQIEAAIKKAAEEANVNLDYDFAGLIRGLDSALVAAVKTGDMEQMRKALRTQIEDAVITEIINAEVLYKIQDQINALYKDGEGLSASDIAAILANAEYLAAGVREKLAGILDGAGEDAFANFGADLSSALAEAAWNSDFDSFRQALGQNLKKAIIEETMQGATIKKAVAEVAKLIDLYSSDGFSEAELNAIIAQYAAVYAGMEGNLAAMADLFTKLGLGEITTRTETSGNIVTQMTGSDRDYLAESIRQGLAALQPTFTLTAADVAQLNCTQMIVSAVNYNHYGDFNIGNINANDFESFIENVLRRMVERA